MRRRRLATVLVLAAVCALSASCSRTAPAGDSGAQGHAATATDDVPRPAALPAGKAIEQMEPTQPQPIIRTGEDHGSCDLPSPLPDAPVINRDDDATTATTPAIPPIDQAVPANLRTALFAVG
ncbi:MAG: hypothetical protein AB7K09_03450 [Planctomycetota bacterium]